MPIQITMPALSPTMEEGSLTRWLKAEGDPVAAGDILAEIETDKATMEFEAVDEGTLAKILVPGGTDDVKVGQPIAILAEESEDVAEAAASGGSETPAASGGSETPAASEGSNTPAASGGEAKAAKLEEEPSTDPTDPNKTGDEAAGNAQAERTRGQAEDHGLPPSQGTAEAAEEPGGDRMAASPLARRMAAERGLDLSTITGTGPRGRIVKADVEGAEGRPAAAPAPAPAQTASPAPPPAPATVETTIPHEVEKLSNMRKTIARRLTEAKATIPHIYLTLDVRLDALLKLRGELNAALEPTGVKLSVNDLLIKALARALIEVPECNVSFAGDQLVRYARADISVAVSIEGGLITPIVEGADGRSLSAISTAMTDLATRAKAGKLKPEEYQGGTASLSNMGMMGIEQFAAVINPPQAMILAVGAGAKRPVVGEDGTLAVATVMTVTGSFDHRAIDGADGARLLAAFKRLCETPLALVA